MSDQTTDAEGSVSDLAAKTQKVVEDAIGQGPRGLQATAEEAIGKAADLARAASNVGMQVVTQTNDAIQDAAMEVGNRASQVATAAYEQGARAKGYISRYTSEQPLSALLIAGVIGYGFSYLIHRR